MNIVRLNTTAPDGFVKGGNGGGNSGGGTSSSDDGRKDVNFFDYDGTLLYAYSWEEAKKLTELPPAPSYDDGNEFIEWNYTLEDIKRQGVKWFMEYTEDGYSCVYSYVKDLTIDGVTYQAYNMLGCFNHYEEGSGYWACLTIGDPIEGGGFCYAESDDGETWWIERDENDEIYWYNFIASVGEVRGHADVGAVTSNSYVVKDDWKSSIINEKCIVVPTYLEGDGDFYVCNRNLHSVLCLANKYDPYKCYLEVNTDRLVVPKDFIFGQNYESIQHSVINDVYFNGGNVGGYTFYENNIINKVYVGSYINLDGAYNDGNPIGILKVLPNTACLNNISAVVIDCSDCIVVPTLNGINTYNLVSVIIPASLKSNFTDATGWSELTSKFIVDNTK